MVLAARFMFWDGQTELRMAWEALRVGLEKEALHWHPTVDMPTSQYSSPTGQVVGVMHDGYLK